MPPRLPIDGVLVVDPAVVVVSADDAVLVGESSVVMVEECVSDAVVTEDAVVTDETELSCAAVSVAWLVPGAADSGVAESWDVPVVFVPALVADVAADESCWWAVSGCVGAESVVTGGVSWEVLTVSWGGRFRLEPLLAGTELLVSWVAG
ncbi:hypothetical protein [Nocardia sp. GP40]